MPLFDVYIMVDWSGAAGRRGRRSDCIWIAHGRTEADEPVTDSPFSRTEAIQLSAKAAVMMREMHDCRSKPKADLAIILSPLML
jgi:hypothetical protein